MIRTFEVIPTKKDTVRSKHEYVYSLFVVLSPIREYFTPVKTSPAVGEEAKVLTYMHASYGRSSEDSLIFPTPTGQFSNHIRKTCDFHF